MDSSDALKSDHEGTMLGIGAVLMGLSIIGCFWVIISSFGKDADLTNVERWARISFGIGIAFVGIIQWAVLKAVSEILVLMKDRARQKQPQPWSSAQPNIQNVGPIFKD